MVETSPGYAGPLQVAFEIADPATGRRVAVTRAVAGAPTQVVTVTEDVSGFAPAAALVATAEAGAIRTPLPLAAGPGWVATFRLAAPAELTAVWDAVLGPPPDPSKPPDNPLRANCYARTLRVPELATAGGPGDPAVTLLSDGRGALVLAPGLAAADVPAALLDNAPAKPLVPYAPGPPATPEEVRVYGYRVSRVVGPATVDSFMSVGVNRIDAVDWTAAGDSDRVPAAAAGVESLAYGLRVNAPLEVGREQHGDDATRSVVEVGRVGVKPFAFVRLDLDGQRLRPDADGLSPARARAYVAALVWAANHVLAPGRPADPEAALAQAEGPEPAPLLTAEDEEQLLDLGRRGGDGLAVGLIGAAVAALTVYAWIWGRSIREGQEP
jgi:hypothetical protein